MTDMTPYQQLAADIGLGESKMIPKMFAFIADEDEAKFMIAASPPATVEEIAEKTGFSVENKFGLGHVICNCDNVGCGNWGHDRAYVKKFTAPSRFKASVDSELCTSCETCAERCFFDAVSMEGPDGTAVIDADQCMGCGICVPTCPGDAITYEEIREKQFIPE